MGRRIVVVVVGIRGLGAMGLWRIILLGSRITHGSWG